MEIREGDGETTFAVRVAPRASRDAIEGEYQGALKVRLTAPPLDGRANEAGCGRGSVARAGECTFRRTVI
jgi:uncharacterized protein YggU (UPF0235/DUF167 family)